MIKPIKKFTIGSSVFFKDYFTEYVEKDQDELQIMDTFLPKTNVLNLKDGKKDVFFWRNMDKEGFITDTLSSNLPMRAGKFLVKEFTDYLGFTIDDLKRLGPMFERMDERHTYEKIIYESYVQNGDFYLTDEQRLRAFNEYKKRRPEIYKKES